MLDIRSISKTFNPGTVNAKKALSGLSLHLEPGDFVTIIGSNGAGKSTLFNAIAGVFYVDEGSDPAGRHEPDLPAGVPAQPHDWPPVPGSLKGTAPGMTIEENLALAYLRSTKGSAPFARISKRDKALFRERLALPPYGAGGPHEAAGGPFVRRTAPGPDPVDGHSGAPAPSAS